MQRICSMFVQYGVVCVIHHFNVASTTSAQCGHRAGGTLSFWASPLSAYVPSMYQSGFGFVVGRLSHSGGIPAHNTPRCLCSNVSRKGCPSIHPVRAQQPARSARRNKCMVVCAASGSSLGGTPAGNVIREILTQEERSKLLTDSDNLFYSQPRFCTHVDGNFLSQLTQLYRCGPEDLVVGCTPFPKQNAAEPAVWCIHKETIRVKAYECTLLSFEAGYGVPQRPWGECCAYVILGARR